MSVIEARERGRVPEDSDETLHDAENQWLDWTGHVLSVWWPNVSTNRQRSRVFLDFLCMEGDEVSIF